MAWHRHPESRLARRRARAATLETVRYLADVLGLATLMTSLVVLVYVLKLLHG